MWGVYAESLWVSTGTMPQAKLPCWAQFEGYKKFRPWAGNFQSQHACGLLSTHGPLAVEGEGAGANNHPCPGQRQSVWPFREEHISQNQRGNQAHIAKLRGEAHVSGADRHHAYDIAKEDRH